MSDSIDVAALKTRGQNIYQLRFAGFLTVDDLRPSTVPENVLYQIIKSNCNNLNYNTFKKFIKQFELRHYKNILDEKFPPGKNYALWYDSYIPSDGIFRFQFIFDKGKLVAIFHAQRLDKTVFKDIKLRTTYLLWTKNNNDKEMTAFANTYHKIFEASTTD